MNVIELKPGNAQKLKTFFTAQGEVGADKDDAPKLLQRLESIRADGTTPNLASWRPAPWTS